MLRWLRGSMGGSTAGMNAMIGAFESFFNPNAARAREMLEEQNQRGVAVPSPGDKLLDEGRIVIRRKPDPERSEQSNVDS
ncbi:MAG: hypothetical protein H0X39_13185 [Actinobacteria bacterium]|nr:hypothetical protein [Actinomycetota bacterium]